MYTEKQMAIRFEIENAKLLLTRHHTVDDLVSYWRKVGKISLMFPGPPPERVAGDWWDGLF